MSHHTQLIYCGSPKHAERAGEPDWSDAPLAELRSETVLRDNPYRCLACGRLIEEEHGDLG